MPHTSERMSHAGAKILDEFRQLILVSLYIYVCLVALQLYTASIPGAQGVSFALLGYAAVKALVLGKFVLLGHWLHIGERFKKRPLIYSVLYQALALLVLLIVLSTLEELIVALVHGLSFSLTMDELRGSSLTRVAKSVVLFLVLLPYVALRRLAEIMRPGELKRILFGQRDIEYS